MVDWVLSAVWPIFAHVMRVMERTAFISLSTFRPERILILTGTPYLERPVKGQDLTDVLGVWARSRLTQDVELLPGMELIRSPEIVRRYDQILVSYDFLLDCLYSGPRGFARAATISLIVARADRGIHLVLPDSFWLRLNFLSEIMHFLAPGSKIVLQNSWEEAEGYGLRKVESPLFWTFPPERIVDWSVGTDWTERENIFVVASWKGSPARQRALEPFVSRLSAEQRAFKFTEHHLSWSDYVAASAGAKYVVTTCVLHDPFVIGPRYYRKKLPQGAISARVWEAFAAGALLISDGAEFLINLGFIPGKHFLVLPNSCDGEWLPDEEGQKRIASAGNLHFKQLIEREQQSFSFRIPGQTT